MVFTHQGQPIHLVFFLTSLTSKNSRSISHPLYFPLPPDPQLFATWMPRLPFASVTPHSFQGQMKAEAGEPPKGLGEAEATHCTALYQGLLTTKHCILVLAGFPGAQNSAASISVMSSARCIGLTWLFLDVEERRGHDCEYPIHVHFCPFCLSHLTS